MALFCAASTHAQFSFGVKAGIGHSFQSKPDKESGLQKNDVQFHPAYQIGLTGEWRLSKEFSLMSGLVFSSKGGKTNAHYQHAILTPGNLPFVMMADFKGENRLNYLELPINILYTLPVGKGHFFAGPGGYISQFLGGTTKGTVGVTNMNGTTGTPSFTTVSGVYYGSIIFRPDGPLQPAPIDQAIQPDNKAHAASTDAGANFTLGYSFKMGLQLSLCYSHGFTDTNYGKNRAATFNIGYLIRR
ncbi:MAG: outer membrane beta-barrel protein [Chitinophaga sp.]|uniref:outer membrane beta-barrel protein n=1 Tax=Chitinophaga sp. TaxID=1869181 RepID=UPI0025B7F5E8|nr:outer membrane beta-barrel protein [Chitinophaga sp.]MBV8255995.1 outer membrane beta-barrel protein [Chitinophaga sp.]